MKIRLRITLLVMLSMLAAGSIALIVNAVVYQESLYKSPTQLSDALLKELGVSRASAEAYIREHPEVLLQFDSAKPGPNGRPSVDEAFQRAQRRVQDAAQVRSLKWTLIGLGILAAATGLGGWLIAGRMLRPIRLITKRARSASAVDLSARVDLQRPDDELKALADTFDAMLDRLEQAFAAQRRFSAHVAHELRTPLAVVRSEAELLLADDLPGGTRAQLENIKSATLGADRLVARLLALGRSESGNADQLVLSLDELVGELLADLVRAPVWQGLRLDVELHQAFVVGDRALIDSLVRNLVGNAADHNDVGGWVRVRVDTSEVSGETQAVLEVTNTSSVDPEAPADGRERGHGIGLAVVEAIVQAHGGRLELTTERPGIVVVRVDFPTAPALARVPDLTAS